jgi:hypothetical protein
MLLRLHSLPILVLLGTAIVLLGGFGDLAFHLLGAARVGFVTGDDGYRAHLVTFAGMLISVTGLVVRAAQTR